MTEVLAIIPARGGSKGIPGKNLRSLNGKPLLVHTIEQARQTLRITRIVVSTDDPQISAIAREHGAEVVWRPADISGDHASSEAALVHALDFLVDSEDYKPDLVVFLQATSPIRRLDDIDRAVTTLINQEADSLVSVVPVVAWLWRIVDGVPQSFNYDYRQRLRRQDRPPEYSENGSIYIFKPWVLRQLNNRLGGKIALYEMNEWSNIDIETMADFELAEWALSRH
jgi:N-acylneuraminate cytidylyltransferase